MGLIGIFIIHVGIGLVYAPLAIWPYGIAGFMVLLGIWLNRPGARQGIPGPRDLFYSGRISYPAQPARDPPFDGPV